MQLNLNGKVALVTASSGGIGLAIARSLAAEGAKVAVNGRTKQNVDRALAGIRAALLRPISLRSWPTTGPRRDARQTIAELPSVDILVDNLGIYEAVGFFDETDEAWQRLFEVNIMSGVRLSRHYLRGMLAERGRIVFISSESGVSRAGDGPLQRHQDHAAGNRSFSCGTHRGHKGDGELGDPRLHPDRGRRDVHSGCLSRSSLEEAPSIDPREPPVVDDRPPHRPGKSATWSPSCAASVLR